MKQFMLTLIFVSIALCGMAQAPRLTRSQLKQMPLVKDHTVEVSATVAKDKPLSLQQVMKERNLTLDDNMLNSKAPSRQYGDGEFVPTGERMASIDAYDFDWDNENATASIIDSTAALMGKCCNMILGEDNQMYLYDFYGSYSIPINVDASGVVTIEGGVQLASVGDSVSGEGGNGGVYVPFKSSDPKRWTLYAVPLSWLTGENEYCEDIHGVVHEDGSIEFSDSFAFLVEETLVSSLGVSSWGLSPIFTNLILYMPNAIHSFVAKAKPIDIQPDSDGLVIVNLVSGYSEFYPQGSGGTVNKPINPRPGQSGATISPGNTKPITPPRQLRPTKTGTNLDQDNTGIEIKGKLTSESKGLETLHRSCVYMYQLDDTTLMVYNLFDKDYCWNFMKIYPDGSIYFPAQPISCTNNGTPLYNCSGYHEETDTLVWGNLGNLCSNKISWGNTYLCSEGETEGLFAISIQYMDNTISLYDDIVILDGNCPRPKNLTVNPDVTTACVAWEDTVNAGWNLRYRPYVDTSNNPLFCDLNGDLAHVIDIERTWVSLDGDGDGKGWNVTMVEEGDYCFQSDSWTQSTGALNPENWLISPDVKLQGELRFTMWGPRPQYSDGLMVYAMVGENLIKLTDQDLWTTTVPVCYTVDLSEFDGEIGNIVFYHHDSYDQFCVFLDDIFIGDPNAPTIEPEPWNYVADLDATSFTIGNLLPEGSYEVSVQAFDADTTSGWTPPVYFTTRATPLVIPDVYILGEVNTQSSWATNVGTKMTYDAENGVYTATIFIDGRGNNNENYFSFTTKLTENTGNGWDEIDSYRFGPDCEGSCWVGDDQLGQPLPLSSVKHDAFRLVGPGTYTLTLSLNDMNLVIEKAIPGYLIGDVNGNAEVRITDVTALISYLLSGDPIGVNLQAADCDKNGIIRVGDVTALIYYLLTGSW